MGHRSAASHLSLFLPPKKCKIAPHEISYKKRKTTMKQSADLHIPETLHRELSKALERSVFKSVDDLAAYILQNYLDTENESAETSPQEDDQAVKERLKNLGYL